MALTRRGTARATLAELSMQQVLEIMRGLQQDMAESKLEQERMQADLDASHKRNEELHRVYEELHQGLRNDRGRHGHDEMENHSPPKGVFHSLLAGDPRCSDPEHVRGTQGDLHRDGGPRDAPCCISHIDGPGRRF